MYRSAPFVPKGLFYVNRSVYLFSLNHFNAFICWVELKRILDCHKRSGIIPAICHSFFHCCHCRISGSHQIPVIPLPTLPDRYSFRNFGLNLFYEHPSIGLLCFCRWLNFAGFGGHGTCFRSVPLELTRRIKNHHDDPSHACKYGK